MPSIRKEGGSHSWNSGDGRTFFMLSIETARAATEGDRIWTDERKNSEKMPVRER